jgi:glycosyltransferase involved in cell wall biosynthesis
MNKQILYITAFVPSRIGAGENLSRQLINDIAEKNRIDLIFFKYSGDKDYEVEKENVKVLKIFRNSLLVKLVNILFFPCLFPLFTVRFNIIRLFQIKKILRNSAYDLVIFDFSQTFLFAKFISDIPVILNCHDVIAQRYSRIYKGMLEPFVRLSEKYVLSDQAYKIYTLSEKDSSLLEKLYSVKSDVTGIFVDKSIIDSNPGHVGDYFVFFANWQRPDNSEGLEWFLLNVLPELNSQSRFKIIGSGLPGRLKSMISGRSDIDYMGFLDDPYQIISDSLALISPLFTGAGVKIKVIEALACGTVAIGTSVSFEGISDKYSRYLKHAENTEEFISVLSIFKTDIAEKTELKALFHGSNTRNSISDHINET